MQNLISPLQGYVILEGGAINSFSTAGFNKCMLNPCPREQLLNEKPRDILSPFENTNAHTLLLTLIGF